MRGALATLFLLLMASVPAADAGLGGAYTATGVALAQAQTGHVWVASLHYTGGPVGTWSLTVAEPGGLVVAAATWPGGEHQTPGCCVVATLYHGYASDSTDFEVTGAEAACAGPARPIVLAGHWQGYLLYLALGTA